MLFILEEEEVVLLFTFEVHEVLVFILEVEEEEVLFIVFDDSDGFVSTLQREQKSSQNGSVPSTLVAQ